MAVEATLSDNLLKHPSQSFYQRKMFFQLMWRYRFYIMVLSCGICLCFIVFRKDLRILDQSNLKEIHTKSIVLDEDQIGYNIPRMFNKQKTVTKRGIQFHPMYLGQMTHIDILDEHLNSFLRLPEVICQEVIRVGNTGDGGWDVCISEPFTPTASKCLVYSFGINYDFSFDDGMASTFGCTVKSFDPSMKKISSHQRSAKISFIREGLSDRNRRNKLGWNLKSFDSILKEQGDHRVNIDYLKIDIEGAEWLAIPDIARKGIMVKIKQIGFEIHRFYKGTTHVYNLIKILENHGFRKWKTNFNWHCAYKDRHTHQLTSRCIEVYFINMNFVNGLKTVFLNDKKIQGQETDYVKKFPDYAVAYDYEAWHTARKH